MKRQIKTFLASGLLALALFGSAEAGPLEDALAAYQHGNYATAVQVWRPLAEQGEVHAQFRLGVSYDKGWGVPRDNVQAAVWYRKSADQGYAPAQGRLAYMYEQGQGVPQDYVRAHMWLNLAASDAAMRGISVKECDRVAAKMTPAQIAEAQRMAREWKPK